jgi:hypothetical protein
MPAVLVFLPMSQYVSRAYPFFAPFFVVALFLFFVVGVITVAYGRFYAFPCPRCEKNINLNAIGQNVRYCPFCGMGLDVAIDPESHEPTESLKKEWGQRGLEIKNTDIQLPPGKQKGDADIQLPPGKEEKG